LATLYLHRTGRPLARGAVQVAAQPDRVREARGVLPGLGAGALLRRRVRFPLPLAKATGLDASV